MKSKNILPIMYYVTQTFARSIIIRGTVNKLIAKPIILHSCHSFMNHSKEERINNFKPCNLPSHPLMKNNIKQKKAAKALGDTEKVPHTGCLLCPRNVSPKFFSGDDYVYYIFWHEQDRCEQCPGEFSFSDNEIAWLPFLMEDLSAIFSYLQTLAPYLTFKNHPSSLLTVVN